MWLKRKNLFVGLIVVVIGIFSICFDFKPFSAQAATHGVSLSTSVQSYLSFDITAGDSITLGSLTPGTPICSATASVASVTTNAANGYTLGLSDGSDTNSALAQGGVYIPDMTNGTITTPVVWGTPGTNTGLGVGLFAADTTKEAKWGTGTAVCDTNNKYASIPSAATTAHTVTGTVAGTDTSSWSWEIDVLNTQKTGAYSGSATFTVTAVLT